MSTEFSKNILTPEQKRQFVEEGYLIMKDVFKMEEIDDIRETFMAIPKKGPIPGYFEPVSPELAGGDSLKLYPRILYPHRIIDKAKKYMLHPQVMAIIAELLEEDALAAQSMFYFKPPGARGQALHQDQYYLRVEPGTCIAAWTAIDPADEENGGMMVVPNTQNSDIQCPHEADAAQSFSVDEVNLPEGCTPIPANMASGDVLFFNGSTIHGSYPNKSKDRFRRTFICHYIGESSSRAAYYFDDDLYNARGELVQIAKNESPGPCGIEFSGAPH